MYVEFHCMCAPHNVIIACKHVALAISVCSQKYSNSIQFFKKIHLKANRAKYLLMILSFNVFSLLRP